MAVSLDQKQNYRKLAVKILTILVGLTCYAIGTALFVLPTDMIAAGTTGLALLAEHYWGISLSGFVAVFNVLMFLLGLIELGKEFALSTLIATFYYPFALDQAIRVVGGMDIPPLVLQKRVGIPVSVSMFAFDFVILLTQLTFRDKEKILYGLIMVMIYTVVLDKVLMMGARQMQVKIVSGQYERISALIQEKLDRGVTLLYIEGGHSGQPSKAVLTVVSPRELARLNSLVTEVDENAFMIISQVGEVHGRGFTLMKKYT